jgi:GMP synthase-like glutamine amidotransferase
MRIHYFIHVPEEVPAAISHWAQAKCFVESYTRFYLGELPPHPNAFDMLVIMGGPMNIYEHDIYSWLVAEKQYIGQCIAANKKVLGICLGAQLLADVLGGKVTRNAETEIGWFPVSKTDGGETNDLLKGITFDCPVLHWHGDTFSIPNGAVHLLKSEACSNQAFLFGSNVLALQFHFEMIPETVESITELDRASLVKSTWVMSEDEIKSGVIHYQPNNRILFTLLDRFAL